LLLRLGSRLLLAAHRRQVCRHLLLPPLVYCVAAEGRGGRRLQPPWLAGCRLRAQGLLRLLLQMLRWRCRLMQLAAGPIDDGIAGGLGGLEGGGRSVGHIVL
jgi:hypothetical protein